MWLGNLVRRIPKKTLVNGLLYAGAFALLAGLYKGRQASNAQAAFAPYPPHHSLCTYNFASQNPVTTSQTFTATVKMYNNGTSTYDPAYGVFLSEYNGGNTTNVWNARGNLLAGPV